MKSLFVRLYSTRITKTKIQPHRKWGCATQLFIPLICYNPELTIVGTADFVVKKTLSSLGIHRTGVSDFVCVCEVTMFCLWFTGMRTRSCVTTASRRSWRNRKLRWRGYTRPWLTTSSWYVTPIDHFAVHGVGWFLIFATDTGNATWRWKWETWYWSALCGRRSLIKNCHLNRKLEQSCVSDAANVGHDDTR